MDFSFTDLPSNEALPSRLDTGIGPTSLGSSCWRDAEGCFQCTALLTGNRAFDDLTLGSGNDCGASLVWELSNLHYYEGIVAHGTGDIPTAANVTGPQNEKNFTGLLLTVGDLPSDLGSHSDSFLFDRD